MTNTEAKDLLKSTGIVAAETWAELGAGSGTFTRALAELLGANGTVHASDVNRNAVRTLEQLSHDLHGATTKFARVEVTQQDLRDPITTRDLDGMLIANALHFVSYAEQPQVLKNMHSALNANGRVVIIEYDRETGNPYVPFPVSRRLLNSLVEQAGFSKPNVVATRASDYGGEIYCAVCAIAP